jgi:hypothetical protein
VKNCTFKHTRNRLWIILGPVCLSPSDSVHGTSCSSYQLSASCRTVNIHLVYSNFKSYIHSLCKRKKNNQLIGKYHILILHIIWTGLFGLFHFGIYFWNTEYFLIFLRLTCRVFGPSSQWLYLHSTARKNSDNECPVSYPPYIVRLLEMALFVTWTRNFIDYKIYNRRWMTVRVHAWKVT